MRTVIILGALVIIIGGTVWFHKELTAKYNAYMGTEGPSTTAPVVPEEPAVPVSPAK